MRPVALLALFVLATPASAPSQQPSTPLRQEVEALFVAMTTALKADPATVAAFYTDDATIMGGGMRSTGRQEIDRYWREATMFEDWKLEVLDVGGDGATPWVRGRSTLRGKSGRIMVTEFVGLLKRQSNNRLTFHLDIFVAASPATGSPPMPVDPT